jgi:hypothetical protein
MALQVAAGEQPTKSLPPIHSVPVQVSIAEGEESTSSCPSDNRKTELQIPLPKTMTLRDSVV